MKFVVLLLLCPGVALASPKTSTAGEPQVIELERVEVEGQTLMPLRVIIPRTRFKHGPTPTELSLLSRAGALPPVEPPK